MAENSARQALVRWSPWIWCALIVLSQTNFAGHRADELFTWLFGGGDGGSGLLHLSLQKGYHVFLFAVFGLLLASPAARRSLRICLLWCLGIGIVGESLQLLSSSRSPQLSDALINVIAGVAAVLLVRRLSRPSPTKAPSWARLGKPTTTTGSAESTPSAPPKPASSRRLGTAADVGTESRYPSRRGRSSKLLPPRP